MLLLLRHNVAIVKAQAALERAVQNFQKSNGIYRAAKETIALAEQRLSEFNDPKVDGAWQEMLNLQTMRFMEAERDRQVEMMHLRFLFVVKLTEQRNLSLTYFDKIKKTAQIMVASLLLQILLLKYAPKYYKHLNPRNLYFNFSC